MRHPPLVVSGQQYCYGQLNLGLAADALPRCLPHLQALLANHHFAQAYTSPLSRCRQLVDALGISASNDVRLMERHFGHWEGRLWSSFSAAEFDPWLADPMGFRPPGGESSDQLRARVQEFLHRSPNNTSILFTHGGVIRMLDCLLNGRPLAATRALDYGDFQWFSW